ncbi:MAG: hypothetical protein KKC84_06210 [Candidatus Omnitrophica bacterium]|nr:hypothetical protein [Candidatus Omnitrophota bacterium]
MTENQELCAKSLLARYLKKVYALVIYLVWGNPDQAYEVVVFSFVEAFRLIPFEEDEETFYSTLLSTAIQKCQSLKSIPCLDESDFIDLPPAKKMPLLITKRALQALAFEEKVVLLLRDQLHLTYKGIGIVMHLSENEVRLKIARMRNNLREAIKEIIEHAR